MKSSFSTRNSLSIMQIHISEERWRTTPPITLWNRQVIRTWNSESSPDIFTPPDLYLELLTSNSGKHGTFESIFGALMLLWIFLQFELISFLGGLSPVHVTRMWLYIVVCIMKLVLYHLRLVLNCVFDLYTYMVLITPLLTGNTFTVILRK